MTQLLGSGQCREINRNMLLKRTPVILNLNVILRIARMLSAVVRGAPGYNGTSALVKSFSSSSEVEVELLLSDSVSDSLSDSVSKSSLSKLSEPCSEL